MSRPGRTMEQRARIKRHFTLATIAVVCGGALAVFLIASGDPDGWLLLVMLVAPWVLVYAYLRSVAKARP
ncbi:hypothetical protein [Streptomyces sp. NPDC058674]|uniref:hypothetical protein n=1 Tax=Streptomyces sp. NPDC058674 TaxID=3346592 RepID=UPI003651303B